MENNYESIEKLMGHDFYYIETDEDGSRHIHIEEYIWDAHEAGRVCYDEDDNEVDADVVVTEFTFCYVPLNELLESDDRKCLAEEYEGEVQQYEGEYTFKQFMEEFPENDGTRYTDAGSCYSAKYLPWDEIMKDTPDGWYYS